MTTSAAETTARIDALVEAAMPRIFEHTAAMEFATFQTACRAPQELKHALESDRESFRVEARVAMLRRLETAWPSRRLLGVGHDVKVTLLPDSPKLVAVFVEPLFVAGRYVKLVRGMSQTVFHCRACRGRRGGCEACGGTRRFVAEAVEDFVRPPIVEAVGGLRSTFHGAGREDVDVRMLGEGRPFVVSVQWAKRRSLDGGAVARGIEARSGGRVVATDLRVVPRAEMSRITSDHAEKLYRAVVRPTDGGAFPRDAAARLAALGGTVIRQRTPERVGKRRADLVRARLVHEVAVETSRVDEITASIRTAPGAYVKELVSGDGGRTEPSFASALGTPCVCAELDVVYAGVGAAAGAAGCAVSAPGTTL
jgi:tRNA pseudouridine synthase 10